VSYENRKLAVLFLQGRADFVHRNYRFECRRRISFVAADAVMTVPAKMVTTDTEAIALYVAAGNPREDWNALDDRDRWPWRKMALEGDDMRLVRPGPNEQPKLPEVGQKARLCTRENT
jgi:hypothetical protein